MDHTVWIVQKSYATTIEERIYKLCRLYLQAFVQIKMNFRALTQNVILTMRIENVISNPKLLHQSSRIVGYS